MMEFVQWSSEAFCRGAEMGIKAFGFVFGFYSALCATVLFGVCAVATVKAWRGSKR